MNTMNSEELPRVSFYFRLYGDSFDPDEVSARLGLQPTKSFRMGDPIPKRTVLRSSDGWIIEIPPRETFEIHDMLDELQTLVPVEAEHIKKVCAELDLKAACECAVLQPHESSTPNLDFPSRFLGWLDAMDASLNIDMILIE